MVNRQYIEHRFRWQENVVNIADSPSDRSVVSNENIQFSLQTKKDFLCFQHYVLQSDRLLLSVVYEYIHMEYFCLKMHRSSDMLIRCSLTYDIEHKWRKHFLWPTSLSVLFFMQYRRSKSTRSDCFIKFIPFVQLDRKFVVYNWWWSIVHIITLIIFVC